MLKARRENLSNLGCVETKRGDIIEKSLIDEKEYIITNKLNRNKRLAHENCRKMRGMVGLK
jgi:hypothetical protein